VAQSLLGLQSRLRVLFGGQLATAAAAGWDWQLDSEQMFVHEMVRLLCMLNNLLLTIRFVYS
jgi:hypothetical protein